MTDNNGLASDVDGVALPADRATHEPSRKRLGLAVGIAIALAGCKQENGPLNWTELPNDPEVLEYSFQQCIKGTTGPESVNYNDWDEAIDACRSHAQEVSLYCPTGAKCLPNVAISQEQVRAVLPKASPPETK